MYLKKLVLTQNYCGFMHNEYKTQVNQIQPDGIEEIAKIDNRVREGCILSLILFNIYIEEAIK